MFRLALASILFPLFAGCLAADGAGDEAIYIVKALAPNDTCSFNSSEDEPYIGNGTITAFSPSPYLLHVQLRSRIVTSTAAEQESKTIQIRGGRVTLDFKTPAIGELMKPNYKKFQTLFTAPLAPNVGSATDARFEVIPEPVLKAIADGKGIGEDFQTVIVAKLVVFGDLAGEEVTSQEFQFPITVCTDCITNVVGTCPVTATPRATNACNPYQDGLIDCCAESDGTVTCPARVGTQN